MSVSLTEAVSQPKDVTHHKHNPHMPASLLNRESQHQLKPSGLKKFRSWKGKEKKVRRGGKKKKKSWKKSSYHKLGLLVMSSMHNSCI